MTDKRTFHVPEPPDDLKHVTDSLDYVWSRECTDDRWKSVRDDVTLYRDWGTILGAFGPLEEYFPPFDEYDIVRMFAGQEDLSDVKLDYDYNEERNIARAVIDAMKKSYGVKE